MKHDERPRRPSAPVRTPRRTLALPGARVPALLGVRIPALLGVRVPALLGVLAAAGLGLLLAPGPEPAQARGAEEQAVRDPVRGRAYFDQAVAWVNDGKGGIHTLTDFYADLADVKFSIEGGKHEGYMRLWLKAPGKYRLELRPERPLARLTTKIISGPQMWVLHPDSSVEALHGRPGGANAIQQMTADRKRLEELARFLTLEGLKGPGVDFYYEGPRVGSGTFEGNWIKVLRRIPNGADLTFHLAYERDPRDPSGRQILCTYPGVVTVVGDPKTNEPTEYYVLKDWRRGPQFRYPGRIEAYTQPRPGVDPVRFLLAFPNDIRINTQLGDELFAPPR